MTTILSEHDAANRLIPTDPHAAIQQLAHEIEARVFSLNQLVLFTVPDSPERGRIIAAQLALKHEIADRLTVVDLLCVRDERSRECAA